MDPKRALRTARYFECFPTKGYRYDFPAVDGRNTRVEDLDSAWP
jgi:hypothetical protein